MMFPGNYDFKKTPCIVATGFTTAYLGDERTLREFIVGDHVKNQITQKGENAILYLINDSYDALKYNQLKIAVNKDERLIAKFENYCGRPIAEIPDPFGCHESYSQHFAEALVSRLHSIDINPVLLDTYQAYQNGYYTNFIRSTFENYSRIQEMLLDNFDSYTIQNLFHAQCPKCRCIDATRIQILQAEIINITCDRCGNNEKQPVSEIKGKLSWKLDCAARWNLYGIDIEIFSKAHLDKLGSFDVSKFISQHFYGGQVPVPVKYGAVNLSRDMSYRLLEILPPKILKGLFTTHISRDMKITRESLENFCRRFCIQPGVSYIDYILNELPKQGLREYNGNGTFISSDAICSKELQEKKLISYANRFSKFYYNKDHTIRLPDVKSIAAADLATAKAAHDVISYTLQVRNGSDLQGANITSRINGYLQSRQEITSKVYRYIRRIFGQTDGPKISTLLTLLPKDYLNLVESILDCYVGEHRLAKNNSGALKVLDFNRSRHNHHPLNKMIFADKN